MQEELDGRLYRRSIIIFVIILLGSVIWFWLVLSKITKDANRVRNWIEVPCLIKSVKIDVEPLSVIANFFWAISYEYEYEGREYTSSRYSIVEKNKVIGGKEKEEIIKARRDRREVHEPYSVGDKAVCFVNPKNPIESVLVREVRNKAIFGRLFLPGVVAANFLIALLRELWRYWFRC